jgi:hypothetical protein
MWVGCPLTARIVGPSSATFSQSSAMRGKNIASSQSVKRISVANVFGLTELCRYGLRTVSAPPAAFARTFWVWKSKMNRWNFNSRKDDQQG